MSLNEYSVSYWSQLNSTENYGRRCLTPLSYSTDQLHSYHCVLFYFSEDVLYEVFILL